MKIIDRLDKYMATRGLNDNQVTVCAGLSVGLLNNARRGNYDLGKRTIEKILSYYQDLNRVWLLTGEGEMIKNSLPVHPENTFDLRTDRKLTSQQIPLFDVAAAAGLVEIFQDSSQEPTDFLQITDLPPVDGAVHVRGNSMHPLLKSGDIIIYKKVEPAVDRILWGQIYLLSYTIGGDTFTVVKYVKRSQIEGNIRLVSYNDFYEPVEIPADSINALALVKASITFLTMQ